MPRSAEAQRPEDVEARYRRRAQIIARDVSSQWYDRGTEDIPHLADAVFRALVEEANMELRQVLAQMGTRLGRATAGKGERRVEHAELAALQGDLARMTALVDQYLERSQALRHLIQLHPEPFDLGSSLKQRIEGLGFRPSAVSIDARIEKVLIQGDRVKLLDALAHIVARTYEMSEPSQALVIRMKVNDDRAEGFIGLRPALIRASELMREISMPLAIEEAQMDLSYARAVLERHGGALFVADEADEARGFAFHLPLQQPGGEDE